MKKCSKCGEDKELSEFHQRNGKPYAACKECHRMLIRSHYENNKQYYIDKSRAQTKSIREWLRTHKESLPCTDCKNFFPYYVTQFDHKDDDKLFNISGAHRKGRKALEEEIAKCDLVCANCHAERTWKRMNNLPI